VASQSFTNTARLMIEPRIRAADLQREAHDGNTTRDCSTVERVIRAGPGNSRIDATGVQRVLQSPLDRLHARGLLAPRVGKQPHDAALDRILFEAGDRWRRDWYLSGLAGPGTCNLDGAGGGSGDPAWCTPATERAAAHRAMWRQARRVLDDEQRIVVGGVVLDERTVYDVGCEVSRRRRKAVALAAGIVRLRSGLRCLAVHYGMLKAETVAPREGLTGGTLFGMV